MLRSKDCGTSNTVVWPDRQKTRRVWPSSLQWEQTPDAVLNELVDQEEKDLLNAAIDALPARERRIFRMHKGLDVAKRTLAEIGRSEGVSHERVRQIERQAMKKITLTLNLEKADGI